MKVLQINVVCGQGSTGRIAVDIANMLKSKGEEAYIAYGYGTTVYQDSYRITTNTETRINAHIYAHLGLQGRGTKYGTKKLLNWIDSIQPDIIHLHNIHGSYVNYPLLFKYIIEKNIPVVWTIHDCWPVTGACAHFVLAKCNKWEKGCSSCSYKGPYKEQSLIDNAKNTYQVKRKLFTSVPRMRLVPVSQWMNNVLKKSFLKGVQSTVIYNGIDLGVFRFRASDIKRTIGVNGRSIILGVASQWGDMKGLNDYFRLNVLKPEDCTIVLVGLSSEQIENLPNGIIGITRTKDITELAELYSAADVTLSLSYAESMGLTLVESMSCGTPVVTYDNTAQPELVTPNTGYVVKTGRVDDVAICVSKIICKGRRFFSSACRNRVEKLFNKEDRYQDYYSEYRKLLNESNYVGSNQ